MLADAVGQRPAVIDVRVAADQGAHGGIVRLDELHDSLSAVGVGGAGLRVDGVIFVADDLIMPRERGGVDRDVLEEQDVLLALKGPGDERERLVLVEIFAVMRADERQLAKLHLLNVKAAAAELRKARLRFVGAVLGENIVVVAGDEQVGHRELVQVFHHEIKGGIGIKIQNVTRKHDGIRDRLTALPQPIAKASKERVGRDTVGRGKALDAFRAEIGDQALSAMRAVVDDDGLLVVRIPQNDVHIGHVQNAVGLLKPGDLYFFLDGVECFHMVFLSFRRNSYRISYFIIKRAKCQCPSRMAPRRRGSCVFTLLEEKVYQTVYEKVDKVKKIGYNMSKKDFHGGRI